MDQLVWPASFCGPPSPASFFSAVGNHQYPALEFQSCDDVADQWLAAGDDVLNENDDSEPRDAGANPPSSAPPLAKRRKRGRKAGPRTARPTISHVEAERQRRERLNRLFCDLRAAVPTVSRMDRASLLSDAVAYIAELRGRVVQLEEAEAEARRTIAASVSRGAPEQENIALEARMVGRAEAALRLTTTASRHAPARLMAALRALDLPVQHACVCRVGGVTVQDVVVDVPSAGLRGEGRLRAALLHVSLQESG
ncbi:hypothetical protein BAE44_0008377 [Dichanthelium oligosanthes]|uniref:Transcription factor n=1 Tax=Dichanthelium oligosanthes TaxID=888268 RepID=A0A1E5VZQ0_9POAL|nr:hypothetical protein BAE44_0008377 [Dichanthelium oligosanthes]